MCYIICHYMLLLYIELCWVCVKSLRKWIRASHWHNDSLQPNWQCQPELRVRKAKNSTYNTYSACRELFAMWAWMNHWRWQIPHWQNSAILRSDTATSVTFSFNFPSGEVSWIVKMLRVIQIHRWHEAWPRWSTSTTSSPVHRDVVSGHHSVFASKSRYARVHTHLGRFSISSNWISLVRRLCLTLRSPMGLSKQEQLILRFPWSKIKHTGSLLRTELVGVDTVRFKAEVQFNTQVWSLSHFGSCWIIE